MGNLKEEAQAYEPTQIKNISELSEVSTVAEIFEENEAEFPYKFIVINKERFKVPVSVLGALKAILEENAELKRFKVKKDGEGLKTKYTVIPLS